MIKNMVLLFLAVFVICFGITIYRKFRHPLFPVITPDNPVVVSDLPTKPPKKDDIKLVPKDEILIDTIPIGVYPSNYPGKVVDVEVLVSDKCSTCTAIYRKKETLKSRIGFYWEPKFFIGADTGGLIPVGLSATIFRFDRYSANGIIGFPMVGVGLSMDITRNFYLLCGIDIRLLEISNLSKLDTYNFSVEDTSKIRPLIGAGFMF